MSTSELEALARAATRGPWAASTGRLRSGVVRGGPVQHFTNGSAQSQIFMCCGAEWMEPGQVEANAAYIAAADPDTVLALIAEIKRLSAGAAKPSKCCPGEQLVPMHSTDTKLCTGCKTEQPWPLEPDQKRTFD